MVGFGESFFALRTASVAGPRAAKTIVDMLSRRNVRIKVMQLLYAQRVDAEVTPARTLRAYDRMAEQSYLTLLFDLYLFGCVLAEATADLDRRGKRLRPSASDRAFRAHLATNPLTRALAASPELRDQGRKHEFAELVDAERLRAFYEAATAWEGYAAYAEQAEPSDDAHLGALLKCHKALMDHEGYNDYLEDRFGRWDEDKSLVLGAAKKVLKALPQSALVLSTYRPDDETRVDFGEHLLRYVLEHDAELQAHIEPVLENWDAARVALLDMILIKMALSELLTFARIPPKVTLNEYVELAKLYSTDKSKEFINGILDRLLHSLRSEGLIVKEGRGLID